MTSWFEPGDVMRDGSFSREDESSDSLFYEHPRFVVHIDEAAIEAIRQYLDWRLPTSGLVLDLMSSWRSHFPDGYGVRRLIGLGLNGAEMHGNPQLMYRVMHDLNANPTLPFKDEMIDGVVMTVSIQYITKPLKIFREILRILKEGAYFHVIYSDRMFPTKAIRIWRHLDDYERGNLIRNYFETSGSWKDVTITELVSASSATGDPLFVVAGRKAMVVS